LFLSAGHRRNTLNANYEEVGVSALTDTSYQGFKALVTAQNFGYKSSSPAFVTGVVYSDSDRDNFYSIGESVAGRTVQLFSGATLLGFTSTANAGGYQIQTSAFGLLEIVYSGAELIGDQAASFSLGSANVKYDLVDGLTIQTNVSATLTRHGMNLTLLSIDNINGSGNGYDNVVIGNKGNNILDGKDGNDMIVGGAGTDLAVFSDVVGNYTITYASGSQTFTFLGLDGYTDTVREVEFFGFADGTFSAAQIQAGANSVVTANAVATSASTIEGTATTKTVTFRVILSGAVLTTQTVDYVFAGTGAALANTNDVSGTMSGTLVFAPGETQKTLTLNVIADSIFEVNETLALMISNASSKIIIGSAVATTVLVNDDLAPSYIHGTALADTLVGTAYTDIMYGQGSNDKLSGAAGEDTLYGGAGDDIIDGGKGGDWMIGGTGNDTYVVDNLLDIVDETGGDGIDLVKSSISFSLSAVPGDVENLLLTGTAALSGSGNALANVITGNSGANTLYGLDGNDTLDGGLGNDTMFGGNGDDIYIVNAALDIVDETGTDGIDTVVSSVTLSLSNLATIKGDVENLTLTGTSALNATGNGLDNILRGNAGNNILAGLGGADVLDGGLGNDTASYAASASGVDASLSRGTGPGGDAEGDTYISIENLIGSSFNDILEGDAGNNVLDGGLGNDSVSYAFVSSGVKVSLALTTAQNTLGAGTDTLKNIENLIGSSHNDILTGSTLANIITGGAGDDIIDGGKGNDIFVYDQAGFGADTIKNFDDNMDKIQFCIALASDFDDFTISGNGTTSVLLTHGSDSIQFTSTANLTLSADDFLFA
jgi:Ca2+-binding RTX toxin-like protein